MSLTLSLLMWLCRLSSSDASQDGFRLTRRTLSSFSFYQDFVRTKFKKQIRLPRKPSGNSLKVATSGALTKAITPSGHHQDAPMLSRPLIVARHGTWRRCSRKNLWGLPTKRQVSSSLNYAVSENLIPAKALAHFCPIIKCTLHKKLSKWRYIILA